MKRLWKAALAATVLTGALFVFAGCGNDAGTEVADADAAVSVNGINVSKNVMNLYLNQMKDYLASFGIDLDDESNKDMYAMAEKQAYDTVVAAAVIRDGAQKAGITVTKDELQQVLDEQLKQSFDSDEAYQEWLTNMDLTEKDVNWIWETQLYDEKLFDKFTEENQVSEEDAKTAYDADPSQYNKIAVSHILIGAKEGEATEEEMQAAEEKAKEIIVRLNNGEDFAEIAKAESADEGSAANGGKYENEFTIHDTTYVPEYVEGAWALENVGDFSQVPVKSSHGYHIIKLDSKKVTFEDLKDEIIEALSAEKASTAYSKYLTQVEADAEIKQLVEFEYYGKEDVDDSNQPEEGATSDGEQQTDTENPNDSNAGTDSEETNGEAQTDTTE